MINAHAPYKKPIMKKKVLVYDNQLGYYDLLNDAVRNGFDFLLFDKNIYKEVRYDAVVFFLHDDIELLDMVKLYDPSVPFVLGTCKKSGRCFKDKETVFTIDVSETKDEIVRNLQTAFTEISQMNVKEEAL